MQDLQENEIVRLSMFTNGVQLTSNRELQDDDLEELLDDELSAEKDLIAIGMAIGAYIATNEDIDRRHALSTLLLSIKAGINSTANAMKDGKVHVEKQSDTELKQEFDENDYR